MISIISAIPTYLSCDSKTNSVLKNTAHYFCDIVITKVKWQTLKMGHCGRTRDNNQVCDLEKGPDFTQRARRNHVGQKTQAMCTAAKAVDGLATA